MKTQQEWFKEYSLSHQNKKNKAIHYVCVPLIYFSVIGLLLSINTTFLIEVTPFYVHPLILNWAVIVLLFALFFYWKLSLKSFILMLLFSIISIVLNVFLSGKVSLLYISLSIFGLAWIGQFYGHHIEGKKPSFSKGLQFLLIGPIWVFHSFFRIREERSVNN